MDAPRVNKRCLIRDTTQGVTIISINLQVYIEFDWQVQELLSAHRDIWK